MMRRRPAAPPDPSTCYDAAMKLLQFRFRAVEELRRKLRDKGYDEDTIAQAVERLTKERWLDDERFAGAYARTRFRKMMGGRRVVSELRELGVDEDLAAGAVKVAAEDEPEEARVRELAERRLRVIVRGKGSEFAASEEGRQKLIAWLMKQGYDYGVCAKAVKDALAAEIRGHGV